LDRISRGQCTQVDHARSRPQGVQIGPFQDGRCYVRSKLFLDLCGCRSGSVDHVVPSL
jgi:hypothetical protein